MNDYEEIENDRLALLLRREARRSRPAFSAALHERLMTAIQGASAPATAATVQTRRGQALAWAMTVTASIALILTLAIAFNHVRTPSDDSVAGSGPVAAGKSHIERLPEAVTPTAITLPVAILPKKDAEDIDAAAEELASSASGIGDWVRSAAGGSDWTGDQWGGLDRDAQRALAAVAGPLPIDLTFSLASADGD